MEKDSGHALKMQSRRPRLLPEKNSWGGCATFRLSSKSAQNDPAAGIVGARQALPRRRKELHAGIFSRDRKAALLNSRFKRAMLLMEMPLGHSISHSR